MNEHASKAQLPKNLPRMSRMQSADDQLMPVNQLQRADVVRMQNIQKNYGGCVPETVPTSNGESRESTPTRVEVNDNKSKTMKHRDLAKKLLKNPTQELPNDFDFFKQPQFTPIPPEDEGDTSGRQEPLLTQK